MLTKPQIRSVPPTNRDYRISATYLIPTSGKKGIVVNVFFLPLFTPHITSPHLGKPSVPKCWDSPSPCQAESAWAAGDDDKSKTEAEVAAVSPGVNGTMCSAYPACVDVGIKELRAEKCWVGPTETIQLGHRHVASVRSGNGKTRTSVTKFISHPRPYSGVTPRQAIRPENSHPPVV